MSAAFPSPRPQTSSNIYWIWLFLAAGGFAALRFFHPWPDHMAGFLASYAIAWAACWGVATTRINTTTLLLGALLWRALFVPLPPT